MTKEYNVYDLGSGWYDFKDLPQGYIKIHGLNCGTEVKALKRAMKILKNNNVSWSKINVVKA